MDNETLKIKQFAVKIMENILLEKEYSSKQEVIAHATMLAKKIKEKNNSKMVVSSYEEALRILLGLGFTEMKEIAIILKNSNK